MMQLGLQFIGVVKNYTKTFPVNYLSGIEITEVRGQKIGVILKTNVVPAMMAYVCMDHERIYFISTASSLS